MGVGSRAEHDDEDEIGEAQALGGAAEDEEMDDDKAGGQYIDDEDDTVVCRGVSKDMGAREEDDVDDVRDVRCQVHLRICKVDPLSKAGERRPVNGVSVSREKMVHGLPIPPAQGGAVDDHIRLGRLF